MGINFSKLVLRPCMTAFADPVTYNPLVSDPDREPFAIRGIYDDEHDMLEDFEGDTRSFEGLDHSSSRPVLGVRLAELPLIPKPGDEVTIRSKTTGELETFQVWDVQPDGQGRADLILKVA